MKTITNREEWQQLCQKLKREGKSIGLVPTMGALHTGHISLVKRASCENEYAMATIFINPTQFNQKSDLSSYPVSLKEDKEMLDKAGVSHLYLPCYEEIYPDNYRYKLVETKLSKELCGATRPGHFDGVLTVVLKLLLLSQADRAYFGEKDWQQLQLIKGMAKSFFLPTKIIGCPLVREESGLAMSSRNRRLSLNELAIAPKLQQIISSNLPLTTIHNQLEEAGFKVDYLKIIDDRLFVAAFLGKTRLIDNIALRKKNIPTESNQ